VVVCHFNKIQLLHGKNMKRKKYLVQISNRQMERCAEIAILDRQNAEIEHQQTHKKQVQN